MSNSTEFLSTFNKLEHYFKEQVDDGSHKPFYALINHLKHSNSNIRFYYLKLKEYSDLRNAIVHERIDGRVIAEPNDYAVSDLKIIYEKISTPQKMIEICNHPVKVLSTKDCLSNALALMNTHDFSQVPIYDEGAFVGMLNPISISTWMSKIMNEGSLNLSQVLIGEVLKYKRNSRVTLFRSRAIDVYEVMEIFKDYAIKPERIDAIIITEKGKNNEKPLTIITDHDILKIVESM